MEKNWVKIGGIVRPVRNIDKRANGEYQAFYYNNKGILIGVIIKKGDIV